MTGTAEAATPSPETPPAAPARAILISMAAPALVLLAIVVPFLRFHEYGLTHPESLILMGAAALIGAATGLLGRLRPATLVPVLTALTLAVYACFRQQLVDGVILAANAVSDDPAIQVGALMAICLALFLALYLLCVGLRRHLDTIVAAIFGTIVVSSVVLPTATGGAPVETGSLPKTLKPLPPVIHIILDEHEGYAGLPEGFDETPAARALLRQAYGDFRLYTHAYSRFAETKFSLTSLMNRDLGADVGEELDGDLYQFAPERNVWLDRLKQQGYAIKVYQTTLYEMCRSPAVDACYSYSFFSPNAVQRAPLDTMQRLRVLTEGLFLGGGALEIGPVVGMEALERFRSDITAAPRGVAYIVHLLLPHSGYLYDSDCRLLDPADWDRPAPDESRVYSANERKVLYTRYLSQLVCSDRQMESLFAYLKTLGVYDDATIIVHGDHGSRLGQHFYVNDHPERFTEQDMIDHYAPLLAIKAPGLAPGLDDTPVALQRIFAEKFLGGALPTSPGPGEVFVRTGGKHDFAELHFAWPDQPDPIAARQDTPAAKVAAELRR